MKKLNARKALLTFFSLLLATGLFAATPLKVLQFNIWQEGTVVPGGFDAIVAEIIRTDADIVTFSEVRNYQQTKFNERVVAALKAKGKIFYAAYSYDSGILSRFPLLDFVTISPEKEDHGSVYKAVVKVGKHRLAVYTAHLDYLHAANYLPRGYHSSTWKKLPAPVTMADSVLADNHASQRDEEIRLFLTDAAQEIKRGSLVVLGGDFNEPSHRDWNVATAQLFDHNGAVIPWENTLLLEQHGYTDSYREKYPDPVTHPGFTFPADNKAVDIAKLAWAPDADDRDRIDFIFYRRDKRWQLQNATLVGPSGSVVYGQRKEEQTKDPFMKPQGIWPTDHKALLVTFTIR
ncbi:endonuclease/exonuclease/phosphatase family protein [Chitinophaga nivalis]|uniref:Endonuclease/exonuclease/phosphatase family protein n=1 Tax=Chitinophaga nivalis TaxID=2991709 RepID=A0ABT3IEA7_9BACT|nr:endonuclease/exonuclease/phosphatase family protein [Chitinophaga nivalis]MCW3468026.1 endonuclease/exonuclease/phosphatase family protein [Chitinophaga nivalis]MCW3482283.1 endonuclease/exonuclease/phosphatase family protein [Chitinophaga nivalis]